MRQALVLALALFLAIPTAVAQERPQQILAEVGVLLQELRGLLPSTPPAPPTAVELADVEGVWRAMREPGRYKVAPGTYKGNFVLSGSDITIDAAGVRFEPVDRYVATFVILGSRVRVTGLTVANGAPDRDTINVGLNAITTIGEIPQDVKLEAVTAEAGPNGGHRGFEARW